MFSGRHRAGLIGGALGVVSAGVAVGLAAERYAVGRARLRPDPEVNEPFGRQPGRESTVIADDGVPLHVEEVGDPAAPVTIVFCHGYVVTMGAWHYQRRDLADLGRLVFWDQRSHGRSGRSGPDGYTMEQLGRDLLAVLDATAPEGPVILVGHSMGGMTIMALADEHPELFGSRVVGVALLSTSAGKLASTTFGLPAAITRITHRALPLISVGVVRRPGLVERGRRVSSDLAFLLTRKYSFGGKDVSPTLVEYMEQMVTSTPADVIAAFYPAFASHDKLEALGVLAGIPVLVLVGETDLVTPADHSRAIAAALPQAALQVVPDGGHMIALDRPAPVNLHLRSLVRRALPSRRWESDARTVQTGT